MKDHLGSNDGSRMIVYSPFSRSLHELKAADLDVLRTVAEGWYVEYKQALSTSRPTATIGKSLSAFANHYGGWLFYGIKGGRESREAESFDGVPNAEVSKYEQELRNAAIHHINPSPFFDHKVIKGPCEQLGLADDRSIIIVHIPSGNNAPYIHSSGRIYRRVADASDPRAETDRATLDLLYERGRRDRSKLSEFLLQRPILSEYEHKNLTFVRLLLMPDPLGDRAITTRGTFDEFAALMARTDHEAGGIPFDNCFTTNDGAIARQISGNDAFNMTYTWRCYRDGANEIIMPIPSVDISGGPGVIRNFLGSYNYANGFVEWCIAQKMSAGKVLDTNFLFASISSVLKKYRLFARSSGWPVNFYAKALLHNVWRRVPFLDTKGYSEFVAIHNLPVIQDETVIAPPETSPESLVELSWRFYDNSKEDELWIFQTTFAILAPILWGLGLPPQKAIGVAGDDIMEIFDLVGRALEVQKVRNQQTR